MQTQNMPPFHEHNNVSWTQKSWGSSRHTLWSFVFLGDVWGLCPLLLMQLWNHEDRDRFLVSLKTWFTQTWWASDQSTFSWFVLQLNIENSALESLYKPSCVTFTNIASHSAQHLLISIKFWRSVVQACWDGLGPLFRVLPGWNWASCLKLRVSSKSMGLWEESAACMVGWRCLLTCWWLGGGGYSELIGLCMFKAATENPLTWTTPPHL